MINKDKVIVAHAIILITAVRETMKDGGFASAKLDEALALLKTLVQWKVGEE